MSLSVEDNLVRCLKKFGTHVSKPAAYRNMQHKPFRRIAPTPVADVKEPERSEGA